MNNPFLSNCFPGEMKRADSYEYFLPADLFLSKELVLDFKLQSQLEETSRVLGQFSKEISTIPNIELFIISYLRKEAVQSSKIEGTKTEIDDAFQEDESEIPNEKRDDWQEVQQYILAIHEAIEELKNLPLCERLIKKIHKTLLSKSRGKDKCPGEYRKSQNWIGGSRPDNAHFVPPTHDLLNHLMSNLEKFIHDETLSIPHLVKIALIHYQFETIHPFLDGNGRTGRILIPLYLLENKMIKEPILYISDFFEKNRQNYYDCLDQGRKSKEGMLRWISFFLDAVIETSKEGMRTTEKINKLKNHLFQEKIPSLGKRAKNGQKLCEILFQEPIINAKKAKEKLGISAQVSQNLMASFVKEGILKEITGNKRNRLFIFEEYLQILR